MSEKNYTPTPWKVKGHIIDSHAISIGEVYYENEANAKHIVHCVNTFDEREALIKEMAEALEGTLRLKDLWLAHPVIEPEHEGEAQALQSMHDKTIAILSKYKSNLG